MGCIGDSPLPEADFSNRDWILLVKATREKFSVSISEAHALILEDETMRRLVVRRVNQVQECRKLALADIRNNGNRSIFVKDGERLEYRT